MRALVTGSAGFIGRHMVKELESRGWDVYGIDPAGDKTALRGSVMSGGDGHPYVGGPLPYRHSYYWKDEAVDFFSSGIRTKFDLVVHCAYHIGGRSKIDSDKAALAKNLQLDSGLFDWAVRTGQGRVLYFSSSAAYPVGYQDKYNHGYRLPEFEIDLDYMMHGWREDEKNSAPDGDYGWAKLTGERLARNARLQGLPVTVVRPFSGYGEDQSLDYPFKAILERVRQGDLTVWGPAGQTRDWIHVEDVIQGSLAVVESGTEDPVNLCTGVGTTMGELAQEMAHALHLHDCFTYPGLHNGSTVTYDETKPTGVFYRVGDPTRMNQYYTAKVSLEEGIRRALGGS